VQVLVVVRDDGPSGLGGSNGAQAMERLGKLRIELRAVERLHSKIYLNESTALVSSMNLLPSSWNDSLEMAIELPRGAAYDSVRTYVFERVFKLGRSIATGELPKIAEATSKYDATRRNPRPARHNDGIKQPRQAAAKQDRPASGVIGAFISAAVRQITGHGYCIRCADQWS
jgi:hypothetical protein